MASPGRAWFNSPTMRCFISYNTADRDKARAIGANLVLIGADVWFDEWKIAAGDSIPGKLDEGLSSFDSFLVIWSAAASRSNWVRKELSSAITRSMQDGTARIIPCVLDETPLPTLICDLKWVSLRDGPPGMKQLIEEVSGCRTRKAWLLAIQEALGSLDVRWMTYPAANFYVCCPKCASEDCLEAVHATDPRLDATCEGVKCSACGWFEVGEI